MYMGEGKALETVRSWETLMCLRFTALCACVKCWSVNVTVVCMLRQYYVGCSALSELHDVSEDCCASLMM
jgi:hypothetical protein